jgi:zinc transport system substrate-binding protein
MPLYNYATRGMTSINHDDKDHDHGPRPRLARRGHEGHHEGADPHIWLGPTQAKVIAKAIATELGAGSCQPGALCRQSRGLRGQGGRQGQGDRRQMKAVDQKGYFVFHEAYGYWERHYGMSSKGHFTVSPERRRRQDAD